MAADKYKEYKEEYKDQKIQTVYYSFFPTSEIDDTGEEKELSSDEKEKQKEKAEELRQKALNGEKLEDLNKEYEIEDFSGKQQNFVGAYKDDKLNEVIDKLEEGEISDVVEANGGYMVIRMDNKNDEEYKEAALQYNAMQDANTSITTMQSNWVNASGYANVEPNADVLAEIDVKKICMEMRKKGIFE